MSEMLLSAREAASELGVRVETLYSYVSRGLIRSEPGPGRARLYSAQDVRNFRQREHGRKSADPVEHSGKELIRSSLTLITPDGPLYHGRLATELAQHGSLEATATLLWGCEDFNPFAKSAPQAPPVTTPSRLRPVERAMMKLVGWPLVDRSVYAHHPRLLMKHGADLCRLVTSELVGAVPSSLPIADVMAEAWGVKDAEAKRLISMALVLCADHELNSSAYAVRVAASTGAPLHAALITGFGAFLGPRHGAASERVDHFFEDLSRASSTSEAMEARLMWVETLPGFGHFLYDDGDPRAECLISAIRQQYGAHSVMQLADEVIEEGRMLFGLEPNIDFALVLLKRLLGLPQGAGMALFCAGRMAGWVGHALEQYQSPSQIRPRAIYTGPRTL